MSTRLQLNTARFIIMSLTVFAAPLLADNSHETIQLAPVLDSTHDNIVIGNVSNTSELSKRLGTLLKRSTQGTAAPTSGAIAKNLSSPPLTENGLHVDSIVYSAQGTPRQLKTIFQSNVNHARSLANETLLPIIAAEFLNEYKTLLRIIDPQQELRLQNIKHDELGRHYLRYSQHYQNIPIWPAELTVQINDKGQVDLLNGYYIPSPQKATLTPSIKKEAAISYAQAVLSTEGSLSVQEARLVLHAPANHSPRLAWKIDFSPTLTSSWVAFIDALHGGLLKKINQVNFDRVEGSGVDLNGATPSLNLWEASNTYYMIDTSKPMFVAPATPPASNALRTLQGTIIIEDANNLPIINLPTDPTKPQLISLPATTIKNSADPNNWSDAHAVSAAYSLSEAYDYFFIRHDVTHIVPANESIKAIVNFGNSYDHAFWQPDLKIMVFGNAQNYAASLDVVTHELSHALINNTARLIYENQSGALNEAFADIFGEAAEARTHGSTDWLVGSELNNPTRNLANPSSINIPNSSRPYPATMEQYIQPDDVFLDQFANQNYGGVHINSTIIGNAFYLLATDLGIIDAEKIFYHTLAFHLNSYSQFIDARLGAIASAEQLFGADSPQALATASAFSSVGIDDAEPTEPPPPIPQVDGSDATLYIYKDSGGTHYLARKETSGELRSTATTALSRPSVSGDGSLAVIIDDSGDVCTLTTSTLVKNCLGLPGQVHSITISPSKKKLAYVDATQLNEIIIVDVDNLTSQDTIEISAPTTDSNIQLSTISRVDHMDFSASGEYIYFNALNEITYSDLSTASTWSIYTANIATHRIRSITPPVKGIDFEYPSLGNTQDNYLTFTSYDSVNNKTYIYAADLNRGIAKQIIEVTTQLATTTQNAAPSFNGNDSAIVYSIPSADTTGFQLMRQGLSTIDHISPVGTPTLWQDDGRFGVIYRRGVFHGPNTAPEGTIDKVFINGEELTAVDGYYEINVDDSLVFEGSAIDGEGDSDIQYEWRIYDLNERLIGSAFGITTSAILFPLRGDYNVKLITTDNFGAADPTPATIIVRVGGGNLPPESTITSPSTSIIAIRVGETVRFVGRGSDADGKKEEDKDFLTYSWDFDGISPLTATGKDPAPVTFNTVGTYTVKFTVTDDLGAPDLTPATVTVIVSEEDPNNNQPIINDFKPAGDNGGGHWDTLLLTVLLLFLLVRIQKSRLIQPSNAYH